MKNDIVITVGSDTKSIREISENQALLLIGALVRLPVIADLVGLIDEPVKKHQPLNPPYRTLTRAPDGLRVIVGEGSHPVLYLADCGAVGGDCLRHLIIFNGRWQYAEDVAGFFYELRGPM